eukprot:CAMPEP_0182807600 /NCGR_PEP_ID=MMETSP0006_2-20121128/6215_1 /TAXON_ID=97485 /ORGANISM="Prymnesium parvum, Strain Texoma1" /LENGTH=200 /DNA_ID=CAMNT_0024933285 /DNA_START=444 /DNA_END=1048 /DNA_ORIENTATION=-
MRGIAGEVEAEVSTPNWDEVAACSRMKLRSTSSEQCGAAAVPRAGMASKPKWLHSMSVTLSETAANGNGSRLCRTTSKLPPEQSGQGASAQALAHLASPAQDRLIGIQEPPRIRRSGRTPRGGMRGAINHGGGGRALLIEELCALQPQAQHVRTLCHHPWKHKWMEYGYGRRHVLGGLISALHCIPQMAFDEYDPLLTAR